MEMLTGLRGRHIPAHPFPKIPYTGEEREEVRRKKWRRSSCLQKNAVMGSSLQGS